MVTGTADARPLGCRAMLRKRWTLLITALLILAIGGILVAPAFAPAHYDGWPDFTIHVGGASTVDISQIRYILLMRSRDLDMYQDLSAEELVSFARMPEAVTQGSITLRTWLGGKTGPFTQTYHQQYGVLLLVPLENGQLQKHVLEFPDLREVASAVVNLQEEAP